MLFVPHLPLHSNIGLNLPHSPSNYFYCYMYMVRTVREYIFYISVYSLVCNYYSYVHYLYYCFSFYCRAGFVLALGCYLPSPIICIYIKLIERKKVHF